MATQKSFYKSRKPVCREEILKSVNVPQQDIICSQQRDIELKESFFYCLAVHYKGLAGARLPTKAQSLSRTFGKDASDFLSAACCLVSAAKLSSIGS